MIIDKKIALKPILESSDGIHLTAYLENQGDVIHLKSQIRETLNDANKWLDGVQTDDEGKKFLEPLVALLHDSRILENMKGNIGIFRSSNSFRILNIPVDLVRQCHVASTFHVKPLLRWMQVDREFLLLGLTDSSAHLYFGNQASLQKVDSIRFPEFFKQNVLLNEELNSKKPRQSRKRGDETFSWLSEWLDKMTQKSNPKLFLAGEKTLIEGLLRNLKYKNVVKTPAAPIFRDEDLSEICQIVRNTLKDEAKRTFDQALLEFRFAEEANLAKKNIFQIAKAAVKGRIKKLIVADGMSVYGKVDKKTGGLAIHPFDLDHEDDDILDDLAQTVLAFGGEVIIAPKEDIPKGRPILAILEHQGTDLEMNCLFNYFESISERNSP